ncbi:MAG: hypothetical protein M1832_001621 [Thelocarpon impressellum]|nr:MAG: hypothetical protein M1832_001621 [Thelocarpon impressellum]
MPRQAQTPKTSWRELTYSERLEIIGAYRVGSSVHRISDAPPSSRGSGSTASRSAWRCNGRSWQSPLLPLLLRAARDLPSARAELRWLRAYALETVQSPSARRVRGWRGLLQRLCEERARGVPLQYLLGDAPFGDVEILCRPGVLIPRPETEAYTTHLATALLRHYPRDRPPRVLDLCTGTGCIPLLLYAQLSSISDLKVTGVDVSPLALRLARRNREHNIALGKLPASADKGVDFVEADVLAHDSTWTRETATCDILTANPPYISPASYLTTTARSVRNHEPKLALVPPRRPSASPEAEGDTFFPPILRHAIALGAQLAVLEVADLAQALRVARLVLATGEWAGVEVWRDRLPRHGEGEVMGSGSADARLVVRGEGEGRAVVCWRGAGRTWLGRT